MEPFLLKFWITLFNNGFNYDFNTSNSTVTVLYTSNNGANISINYSNMRLALSCAISQLLIYFAAIGRIQIYKVMISNFFFILVWTLNYAIVAFFIDSYSEGRINDDYGICFVYLFGGFAGLVVILDAPSRIKIIDRTRKTAIYPKILAILGTFFMCLSFSITHSIIGKKDNGNANFDPINDQRVVFYPEGAIGMLFAISASVISSAAWSVILNSREHKFALTDFIGSSISGAIMFGPVGQLTSNLAIPIVLGLGGGLISVLYKEKALPRINKKKMRDSMGLLGPFLIVPFVGNFISTPVTIFCYSTYGVVDPQLGFKPILSTSSRYVYIYYILCSVMGLLGGMSISSVFRWFKGNETHFGDRLSYHNLLGLKEYELEYREDSSESTDQNERKVKKENKKKKEPFRVRQSLYYE